MLISRLTVAVLCTISVLSLNPLTRALTPQETPPRDVELCDLVKNPTAFDRQLVRFRGRLQFEFEGDLVDDNACGMPFHHTPVWWTYGGSNMLLPPPQAKRVRPEVSPIIQDEQFQKFDLYAHLRRAQLPNGNPCPSRRECSYYDVVATFVGTFLAGGHPPRRLGGYGHMGCCYLLAIEQISDVAFQRTPIPPDDLVFSCTTTAWQSEYPITTVSSIDERVERNRQFLINQARSLGDGLLADKMKTDSPWQFVGLTGSFIWSSPDLLTTYTARFPQSVLTLRKKRDQQPESTMAPLLMNVSREHCKPVVN